MTRTLAQIIALIANGNEYLTNNNLGSKFYPNNSTFEDCQKVDFREISKKYFFSPTKEKIISENPEKWFKFLKKKRM